MDHAGKIMPSTINFSLGSKKFMSPHQILTRKDLVRIVVEMGLLNENHQMTRSFRFRVHNINLTLGIFTIKIKDMKI